MTAAVAEPAAETETPAAGTDTPAPPPTPAAKPALSVDDLHELIGAYNGITEKLQQSHEALQGEVKRLRAELASTSEQLHRSKRLAALGEMAAGIAHEVRNPLGAIGLYAELVAADLEMAEAAGGVADAGRPPVREARGNAAKITGAVRSLSAVVNDVLSFAQQAEPRTVDLFGRKTAPVRGGGGGAGSRRCGRRRGDRRGRRGNLTPIRTSSTGAS